MYNRTDSEMLNLPLHPSKLKYAYEWSGEGRHNELVFANNEESVPLLARICSDTIKGKKKYFIYGQDPRIEVCTRSAYRQRIAKLKNAEENRVVIGELSLANSDHEWRVKLDAGATDFISPNIGCYYQCDNAPYPQYITPQVPTRRKVNDAFPYGSLTRKSQGDGYNNRINQTEFPSTINHASNFYTHVPLQQLVRYLPDSDQLPIISPVPSSNSKRARMESDNIDQSIKRPRVNDDNHLADVVPETAQYAAPEIELTHPNQDQSNNRFYRDTSASSLLLFGKLDYRTFGQSDSHVFGDQDDLFGEFEPISREDEDLINKIFNN